MANHSVQLRHMLTFEKPNYEFIYINQIIFPEQLAAVPELANLGPLFKSSNLPLELTESETEYMVRCVKHTFPHHIVFQVGYSEP